MTTMDTKNIMKAIFNVQQTVPPLKRESTGSTGKRDYKYTTLDKVWESAQASLKKEELVVTSTPTTGENSMGEFFKTKIYHLPSGEWIEETMQMTTVKADPQAIGSAITYYRRYMMVSMLGLIVQGDDNDASDHKLATANQKAKIIGAVKEIFPDVTGQAQVIETIQNIIGKHPSYIRENEAEDALATIKAFTSKAVIEDESQ